LRAAIEVPYRFVLKLKCHSFAGGGNFTRFRGASFVFHPLSRGMILCTGDVHPIITTVVITIVISIVIAIAITIVITIVIVVCVVLVIVIVVFVVVAVVATAIGIILHSHHAQTPHVVAAPLPISK